MKRPVSSRSLASTTASACWTPDQALVVVELLDTLRETIWARYGEQLFDARLDRYLADWHRKAPRRTKKSGNSTNGWSNPVPRFHHAQSQHPKPPEFNDDELPF
jgi:hypothetical protein